VNIKIIAMDFKDAVSVYADDAIDIQYVNAPTVPIVFSREAEATS
jgi:hypothetical protein